MSLAMGASSLIHGHWNHYRSITSLAMGASPSHRHRILLPMGASSPSHWHQILATPSHRQHKEFSIKVCARMAEAKQTATAYVRLATPTDVPHILSLIQQLADFELLRDMCVASEDKLKSTLFNLPAFQGPTVLLLELATGLPQVNTLSNDDSALVFEEVAHEVRIRDGIEDTQAGAFKSLKCEGRFVAGFVLFFPNYSTFLAKPGFYVEDLFVRDCFRGLGFGTILLKTVAQVAKKLDYGRVEWCVLDWNEKAIKFYEGIGAKVHPEWRICRLTGDALTKCGSL